MSKKSKGVQYVQAMYDDARPRTRTVFDVREPKRVRADRITRDYQATSPYNLMADAEVAMDEEAKLELRRRLIQLPERQLEARLKRQIRENRAVRMPADRGQVMPLITRILDTGGTSTGNVLPRVDLEQTITS